jgi:hypothetical protein
MVAFLVRIARIRIQPCRSRLRHDRDTPGACVNRRRTWTHVPVGNQIRMVRRRGPPSQRWKTFLDNHVDGIAAMDLFVVPTMSFRLLFGLLILRHDRREILWFGVTEHPTAEWIARQLTEAFGWAMSPRYLVRVRDHAYGDVFVRRVRAMGIRDRPTAARSPWQNGYCERAIGSIRRDCLDQEMLISRISRRTSSGTVGLPPRGRDFQRQYDLKPARCRRTMVSGLTIANASQTLGNNRYRPTNINRSKVVKESFFGAARRKTFICCRKVKISASSIIRDRSRSTTVQPISPQRSFIPQQDCLILYQLPAG